jgi:cysteine-rich repeat protein
MFDVAVGTCHGGVCAGNSCGNGVVDPGEMCDDGNTVSGDGCRGDCMKIEMCGDGVIDVGEECDNTTSCEPNCTLPRCGNGILDPGEVCDDGNTMSGDGCNASCSSTESCGNGILDPSEGCDMGAANSDAPDALCRNNCTLRRCGDGILDPMAGEQCEGTDLGGLDCTDFGFYDAPGLSCDPTCTPDRSGCTGFCGDRTVNGGELCDGQAPAGQTCLSSGYDEGPLDCLALCAPNFSACRSLSLSSWAADATSVDPTIIFNAVWGSGGRDVFAVGDSGTIVHWDGTAWTTMASGTAAASLRVAWGTGPNDVYVGGQPNTVLHYDGVSWSSTAAPPAIGYTVTGLWGFGPNDLYTVSDAAIMGHYDGTSWTFSDTGLGANLSGLWGSAPNDLYAGGGEVFHYDGSAWSQATFTGLAMIAVWGSSASDVFAVGGDSSGNGAVLHWDGAVWTTMTAPGSQFMDAVWGEGPADVFAVDSVGNTYHYDGTAWTPIGGVSSDQLTGVYVGDGRAFAVGYNATLARDDAERWAPTPSDTATKLLTIAPFGASVLELGGTPFGTGSGDFRVLTDGAWNQTLLPGYVDAKDFWVGGPSDVFACGFNSLAHWDGVSWSTTFTPNVLYGVWGASVSDVYAVGSSIWHWDGTTWTQELAGPPVLNDVWGSGSNDVFAVGQGGAILHYDGTSWTTMTSGTWPDLESVWGTSPTDVFAVGLSGTIVHYDGAAWTAMPSYVSADLEKIEGIGPDDVLAVGFFGAITHYDGTSWAPMHSGTAATFRAVLVGKNQSFVGGDNGFLLTRQRPCADIESCSLDGHDDDCDGLIDCGDPDCASAPECIAGGLCPGATPITCADTAVSGSTIGGANHIDRYACDDWQEHGREAYYEYTAATSGTVTVTLTTATARPDLDLIVLAAGAGGGCEPRNPGCLDASSTTGDEYVTFTATAGRTYYIVVDGIAPGGGDFTIGVSCL